MSDIIDSFRDQYAFLSNFHPSPITSAGITYPTVEHYFQAMKTKDVTARATIASMPTPSKAKYQGRALQLRDDWQAIKLHVMRAGLKVKFATPDTNLSMMLRATGSALLIEGNNWGDTFWGQTNGQGQNWLGHLLMARRAELWSDEV